MELKFEALVKDYGAKRALDGVSFLLQEGIHGLIGPNGAGKSTLMNILSGNLRQTSGIITYGGTDIRKLGTAFQAKLGYMPQQQALYPHFTVYRFLSYIASLRGMSKAWAKERIGEVLSQVELTEAEKKPIGALSGGMKQRLLIAQAVLADPEIIVLDEPTAGLDPKQRIAIRNLIASIAMHKIVIISTHVVSDVEFIARDILLLREGKLLSYATRSELTQKLWSSVQELTVPEARLAEYQSKYPICSIAKQADGIRLRLLSHQPVLGAQTVEPTLEDVYLHCFGE